MKLKNLERCWISINLIAILVCFIVLGYWKFIDGEYVNIPLTYGSNTLTVDSPEYNQGEPIFANWKFCKGVNMVSKINSNIIDGVVWYLPEIDGVREKGCYDKMDVIAKVPESIPNGKYHVEMKVEYKLNPIKTKIYHFKTNDFLIK